MGSYVGTLLDRNPNTPLIDIPYNYTYDTDGKVRKDWSGTQSQLWTSEQRNPQKVKFPYAIKSEKVCGYIDVRGYFTNKCRGEDRSGGQWYFEDELVMTYAGDKRRNNISMDGWTGGKILMTKQQAFDMGLTPDQVLNYYKQDELFKKRADSVNRKPAFFFEYRKDGSIIGIFKPPIVPPPVVVAPPPALVELQQQLAEAQLTPQMIQQALSAPPPEPVYIEIPAPVVEPASVGNLNPYQLKTTIDPKWILLAVVGVGILSAMIFIMRGKK
jgi:hypothetical protein